jgi:peptidoglycan/xylan/chitin deacetylase (PgdA/CDA1 family)
MSPSLLDIKTVRDHLSQRILCEVGTSEKRLALTFDDGPHPRHTPQLLEMLERKGIRATFFMVGRRVRRFRDVLKQTAEAGHEIGNHGDHHLPLSILPEFLIRREIAVTETLIERVTGIKPRFLRPPMGWFNDRVLAVARDMDYQSVIGNIHPQDSRRPGTPVILQRIRRRLAPGAIIILHDGGWHIGCDRSQTIAAVDVITDELLERGYRFETMSRLVGESYEEPA